MPAQSDNSHLPASLKRFKFLAAKIASQQQVAAARLGLDEPYVQRRSHGGGVGGLNPPLASRTTHGIRTKPQINFLGGGRGTPVSGFSLLKIVTV
jgi:hypothetical protein